MDHSFNPIFAKRYGMVAAVIIHDLAYWIGHNRANGHNFYDGRYWTFNSAKAFQEMYPYMGKSQIYSALNRMLEDGLLVKGEYNENKWKHTPWYAITDRGYAVMHECEVESSKMRVGRVSENRNADVDEIEPSSCEKSNDDATEIERRRLESDTSYNYIHNTILSNTDTDTNTEAISTSSSSDNAGAGAQADGDSMPSLDTVEAYAVNNLMAMSARAMEELGGYVDDLSEDIVRHAIDNALDNGVRKWAYVRAILMDYLTEGVKSVGEAKAYDERRRRKRDGPGPGSGPGPRPGLFDPENNRVPVRMGRGQVL